MRRHVQSTHYLNDQVDVMASDSLEAVRSLPERLFAVDNSLSALVQWYLHVANPAMHRALDDCRLLQRVIHRLHNELRFWRHIFDNRFPIPIPDDDQVFFLGTLVDVASAQWHQRHHQQEHKQWEEQENPDPVVRINNKGFDAKGRLCQCAADSLMSKSSFIAFYIGGATQHKLSFWCFPSFMFSVRHSKDETIPWPEYRRNLIADPQPLARHSNSSLSIVAKVGCRWNKLIDRSLTNDKVWRIYQSFKFDVTNVEDAVRFRRLLLTKLPGDTTIDAASFDSPKHIGSTWIESSNETLNDRVYSPLNVFKSFVKDDHRIEHLMYIWQSDCEFKLETLMDTLMHFTHVEGHAGVLRSEKAE